MAPIPKDNQEKPPPDDDSNLSSFSNFNLQPVALDSDFSDDENYPDTVGYTLLPQEPGNYEDSDDSDNEHNHNMDGTPDATQDNTTVRNGDQDSVIKNESTIDDVIRVADEAGASAPTITGASTSLHPEFLAKFPDGKVPSYMQVPVAPTNSIDCVWNKKRPERSIQPPIDSAQETNVLKAMSGFALPSENVPEWAKNLSDDQWKKNIVQRIRPGENQHNTDNSDQGKVQQPEGSWIAEFPDS